MGGETLTEEKEDEEDKEDSGEGADDSGSTQGAEGDSEGPPVFGPSEDSPATTISATTTTTIQVAGLSSQDQHSMSPSATAISPKSTAVSPTPADGK